MNKKFFNQEVSYKLVSLTFGILVLCFAVGFYALAWHSPTASPPGNNVAAPLNVSSVGQTKAGGLMLNTGGAANGLIVDKGNVGIGTTNPATKLDIYGDVAVVRIDDSSGTWGGGLELYDRGVAHWIMKEDGRNEGTDQLDFLNGNDKSRVSILQNGNVGIGTTAPSQKLDVAGYVKGQSGLCIGDDCRSSWPSASIRVSQEYNCDRSRNESGWCNLGVHMACFLTAAHGSGDDDNDCRISGTPGGNWSIYSWCADDPWLHCRARCLDW